MLTYSSPDDVGDASTDSRQQQKKWKFEKPLGNRHADREVDEVCDPKHESNCEQMLPSGSTNKESAKKSGVGISSDSSCELLYAAYARR